MDQQCRGLVKHIIKCFSRLPLSLTYVLSNLSLNRLINHLINYRLLDACPTVIQTSPQLINISHRILTDSLLYHCRDSVIYVLKSGMLGSYRLCAIIELRRLATKLHNGCVCTVRWPAVLLKLKLILRL